jgi:hypothetical protein
MMQETPCDCYELKPVISKRKMTKQDVAINLEVLARGSVRNTAAARAALKALRKQFPF